MVIFLLDEVNFFQKQEDFKNGAQGDTISITTEDVSLAFHLDESYL